MCVDRHCVGRIQTFFRRGHAHNERTFHFHTHGGRIAAHRHARHVTEHAAHPLAYKPYESDGIATDRSLSAPQMPTPLGGAVSVCMTATVSHYNE